MDDLKSMFRCELASEPLFEAKLEGVRLVPPCSEGDSLGDTLADLCGIESDRPNIDPRLANADFTAPNRL